MATRGPTVQHLWNRFMAAVLFVLGAALTPAASAESEGTRVSRAESRQLEAAALASRQLTAALPGKLDGAGNDRSGEPAPFIAPVSAADSSKTGEPSAISRRPAWLAERLPRDGESRAPPSV
jgi:hypothetical protein